MGHQCIHTRQPGSNRRQGRIRQRYDAEIGCAPDLACLPGRLCAERGGQGFGMGSLPAENLDHGMSPVNA
jgi:hypothetical protein